MIAHGADTAAAGVAQVASNRETRTFTAQGTTAAAKGLGASDATAYAAGEVVDIAAGLLSAGTTVTKAPQIASAVSHVMPSVRLATAAGAVVEVGAEVTPNAVRLMSAMQVAGQAANAAEESGNPEGSASNKPNLNRNDATSNFGLYEIETPDGLNKVGKADLNRTTKSSGLPTRLHQQVRKLEQVHGQGNVKGTVVKDLGNTTTANAKAAENARIKQLVDETGKVPPGNEKSYRP